MLVIIGIILIIFIFIASRQLYKENQENENEGCLSVLKRIFGIFPKVNLNLKVPNLFNRETDTDTEESDKTYMEKREEQDTEIIDGEKEVFNLNDNVYTYKEAQAACKSAGARLATHHEVVRAQAKGANWCNYGWSDDQLALFPIQAEYLESIKNDPVLKNSCGVAGVNGGYFAQTDLKLGANCYGVKPRPHEGRIEYTDDVDCIVKNAEKLPSEPITEKTVEAYINSGKMGNNRKVNTNRSGVNIRPFNHERWSTYSCKKSIYHLDPRLVTKEAVPEEVKTIPVEENNETQANELVSLQSQLMTKYTKCLDKSLKWADHKYGKYDPSMSKEILTNNLKDIIDNGLSCEELENWSAPATTPPATTPPATTPPATTPPATETFIVGYNLVA
jgi:hypothetical protein